MEIFSTCGKFIFNNDGLYPISLSSKGDKNNINERATSHPIFVGDNCLVGAWESSRSYRDYLAAINLIERKSKYILELPEEYAIRSIFKSPKLKSTVLIEIEDKYNPYVTSKNQIILWNCKTNKSVSLSLSLLVNDKKLLVNDKKLSTKSKPLPLYNSKKLQKVYGANLLNDTIDITPGRIRIGECEITSKEFNTNMSFIIPPYQPANSYRVLTIYNGGIKFVVKLWIIDRRTLVKACINISKLCDFKIELDRHIYFALDDGNIFISSFLRDYFYFFDFSSSASVIKNGGNIFMPTIIPPLQTRYSMDLHDIMMRAPLPRVLCLLIILYITPTKVKCFSSMKVNDKGWEINDKR